MRDAIQIAGVIDGTEAALLCAAGVDYLGFPLRLRDGREDLSEADAARIVATLPVRAQAVVITYLDRGEPIAALCERIGVHWVQLHGAIDVDEIERLKSRVPRLAVIKSLIVRDGNRSELEREVHVFAPRVDAFITDTFDPATGRSGATGRTHDWSVSRALVEMSPRPVILAGGLDAGNVRAAICEVRPAAVDAHSGVEGSDGRKDLDKIRRFVAAARAGFAAIAR
jgi:phosphoribosylanthranilate isomerase